MDKGQDAEIFEMSFFDPKIDCSYVFWYPEFIFGSAIDA
jgi:hypothetical protein